MAENEQNARLLSESKAAHQNECNLLRQQMKDIGQLYENNYKQFDSQLIAAKQECEAAKSRQQAQRNLIKRMESEYKKDFEQINALNSKNIDNI